MKVVFALVFLVTVVSARPLPGLAPAPSQSLPLLPVPGYLGSAPMQNIPVPLPAGIPQISPIPVQAAVVLTTPTPVVAQALVPTPNPLDKFIPIIAAATVASAKTYIQFPGTDLSQNDIEFLDIPHSECSKRCDANANCVAYVLRKEGNSNGCWLKSSAATPSSSQTREAYVVAASASKTYEHRPAMNYHGNDIVHLNIEFSQCPAACDATPGCVGFAQDLPVGRGCWLKSKLENPHFSKYAMYVVSDTFSSLSYTPIHGYDFMASNIEAVDIPFNECPAKCEATAGCVGYTIHKQAGRGCSLKSAFSQGVASPNDVFISRKRLMVSAFQEYRGTEFAAGELMAYKGTKENCEALCLLTAGCRGFTMSYKMEGCSLKNSIGSVKANDDVVSYLLK